MRVSSAYWALCPSQKWIAYYNCPSFLLEAVLRCGVNCLFLYNLTGGPSTTSSPTSSSRSRAANLLQRGTWGSKAGREGGYLWHQTRTCFKPSSSFWSPTSAWQSGGLSPFRGISLGSFWLSRQEVTPPVNLLLTVLDGPQSLNILLKFHHHAEQMFHLFTPAGGMPVSLPWQALALPAA